jgi:hypothetical protein
MTLAERIEKYLGDHEVATITCPSHELLWEALTTLRAHHETTEQSVWGLESRHEDGEWLTYYALYPTRAQAQLAAGNGRPVGVEWRVVEYRKRGAVEPS